MTHHDENGGSGLPEHNGAAVPTTEADEAANHLGQEDAGIGDGKAAGTLPQGSGGLASGLQRGSTMPGKAPGASVGSLGTGGGSTANRSTGAVKKGL